MRYNDGLYPAILEIEEGIRHVRPGMTTAECIAQHLEARGYLVSAAYEVPDIDKVYRDLTSLEYAIGRKLNIQLVMCREIQDALVRKYSTAKYARYQPLTISMAEPEVNTVSDMVRSVMQARRFWPSESQGSLFDIPIRIDPAARKVQFEILPKEERR